MAATKEKNAKGKAVDRRKQYNQYVSLKYTPVIEERDSKRGIYYVATIPQFPGLLGTGPTREEAIADMEEAKGLYILDMLAENELVPLPDPEDIKVSVFFTGQTIDPSQSSQQFENIVIKTDLAESRDLDQPQTKQLVAGALLEYASPVGMFHADADLTNRANYSTSAPTVKIDQSNLVFTH